jgi:hypothetical protein
MEAIGVGMTDEQFKALSSGDLVRHKNDASAYIVQSNHGGLVLAVRSAELTNPSEWDQVRQDGSVIPDGGDIVRFLRQGGDRVNGVWYSWDSEMAGYARSFAERIERGDHRK